MGLVPHPATENAAIAKIPSAVRFINRSFLSKNGAHHNPLKSIRDRASLCATKRRPIMLSGVVFPGITSQRWPRDGESETSYPHG